jgi:hypothetical protein
MPPLLVSDSISRRQGLFEGIPAHPSLTKEFLA